MLCTRPSSSPSTAGMGTQSKSPRACFRPQHAAAGVITLVPYLARALSNRPPGIRPPCPDPTASPRHLQAGHGNRSGVSVQKALVEQIQQKFLSIRTAVGHTHVSSSREKPPVPSFFQTPEGLTTVVCASGFVGGLCSPHGASWRTHHRTYSIPTPQWQERERSCVHIQTHAGG